MARKTEISRALQKRAEKMIPGGVNSPVRAFRAVGGDPPFIVRGEGARMFDADGNEYIDYVGSWGPLILGHSAPEVVEAVIGRGAQRHQLRRLHPERSRSGRSRDRGVSLTFRRYGSSVPAPRPPCPPFASRGPTPSAST